MMFLARVVGVWFLLLVLAVMNGATRIKFLIPYLGEKPGQVLSGLLLAAIIFGVTLAVYPFLQITSTRQAWMVGLLWLVMTVAFEFLFGHYVGGDSWSKLLKAYDVTTGNLWVLDLVAILLSPFLAGKIRRFF